MNPPGALVDRDQRGLVLGDHLVPALAAGVGERHPHHPAARGEVVGVEIERVGVARDGAREHVRSSDDDRKPGLEVTGRTGQQPVALLGALRHHDEQPPPVLGHLRLEEPLRLLGRLEDEQVVALRRTQGVEPELHRRLSLDQVGARGERRRRRVVETRVVRRPGGPGELGAPDGVGRAVGEGEIVAGGHVAHAPHEPVGAGLAGRPREQCAVVARAESRHRGRPVAGERVGVEQHAVRQVGGRADEEHRLRLEPGVAPLEPGGPVPGRRTEGLAVPDRGQLPADLAADRDTVEPGLGVGRLLAHPGLRLR